MVVVVVVVVLFACWNAAMRRHVVDGDEEDIVDKGSITFWRIAVVAARDMFEGVMIK